MLYDEQRYVWRGRFSETRFNDNCLSEYAEVFQITFGQMMMQNRLKSRKTRKQMAAELGVSVKTLWGWETDRWLPLPHFPKSGV